MSTLTVKQIKGKADIHRFISLPRQIYSSDPLWVPPLWADERADYLRGANPVLRRSVHALFLVKDGRRILGRIIAYVDSRHNRFHRSRKGFFGSYEAENHPGAAAKLIAAAETWLRNQGMEEVLGPINPVPESWGFLLQGETPPVFLSPHNPLYYNDHFVEAGYHKGKDLLVQEADCGKGYVLPERFTRFAAAVQKRRPELSLRTIRRDHLMEDSHAICRILNESVAGNWGFVPVKEDEMEKTVSKLKLILDEQAIWFVEDRGRPVAVALGFPDINVVLKEIRGRLHPLSLLKLLRKRKHLKDYRLWGLAVLPEYHCLGLDVLLYVSLYKALKPRGIRLEANYMLEDNPFILNALKKMDLRQIKTYRVYEKSLLEG